MCILIRCTFPVKNEILNFEIDRIPPFSKGGEGDFGMQNQY